MRLQKYMAMCNVASRRMSEKIIESGRVSVNGRVICEMGFIVGEGDTVTVDGKEISPSRNRIYILLNKPCGVVTTSKDQFGRECVNDLINDVEERIYPVGRLDYDTSGIIIMTNDGDFTNKVIHPSSEIEKEYIAQVLGTPDKEKIELLKQGILLDGVKTSPAIIEPVSSNSENSTFRVIIHEGRNRQVRRMFSEIGHEVIKLERVRIGNISLGGLRKGEWRLLTEKEIKRLLNLCTRETRL